jgi:hypothetical protein
MNRPLVRTLSLALLAVLLPAAGLHPGADAQTVLDQTGGGSKPTLIGNDLIATPGQEVLLEASLSSGMGLSGIEGKRIQFHLGDRFLGELSTNRNGDVALPWKAPAEPGDYLVRLSVHPLDQPPEPVEPADLLVTIRPADTPIAIIDLDKTLVASGFVRVLLGAADPMPGSQLVTNRLAETHTIVYLTQRPDPLARLSKRWLAEYSFPPGPVLTSPLGSLLSGSGLYKATRLGTLKQHFTNLDVGIGDKPSDARAYVENGLRAILILHINWAEDEPEDYEKLADELATLPDAVQVVTNWAQVADALFNRVSFPREDMIRRLRDVARDLRRPSKK